MKTPAAIFLFFLVFSSVNLQGQTELLEKDRSLPCVNKDFTIMAHIVRDTFGNLTATEDDITEAVNLLNVWFQPICVSFQVAQVDVIENFQYSEPYNINEWEQMWINHNYQNRINLYVVNDVSRLTYECVFAGIEGILNLEADGVMIQKGCLIDEPLQLVHAFGHYCGLYNTNEVPEQELADGSNCATAGDLICDTPADPYDPNHPLYELDDYINANCGFIFPELDANEEYYVPQTGNVMSYYPSFCWCGFTQDQFIRMAEVIEQSDMW